MNPDSTKTTAGVERPRTWTLLGEHGAHTVLGEKLPPFHRVRVIELEPVLNLLEAFSSGTASFDHQREALDLLREHGRLVLQ